LSERLRKFNGGYIGVGACGEEVGIFIVQDQYPVTLGHYWEQLIGVAKAGQGNPAKGPPRVRPMLAEKGVNAVKQVSTHHADFIDNQALQRLVNLRVFRDY
jgi:hypothetical protein